MKSFFKVWWIALAVKTVIAICLPLSNDEAYYWVWGHHPHLSYFDHPPMVGWLFYLGTFLENIGHAARLPGVIVGHLTLLVWHKILSPYLNEKQLKHWLIFVLFSPFIGLGSLIQTPDVPMIFFWSLSLLLLLKLLEQPKLSLYAALGASLGLGFCSKYLIVIFVPIAIVWLIFSGEWRKVRWVYVPVTILVGLIFCLPVLIWNAENEWASFAFQLGHGLVSQKKNPMWPVNYLLGQIAILFPTTIWFALSRKEPRQARFLHYFGWLPILFFFSTSFRARVEGNWPAMAHPALLSLAFSNGPTSKWLRGTVVIWILATVLVFSQVLYPWIPVDSKKLKTSEFSRYDILLPIAKEKPELYFFSYQMAAAVSYKMKKQFFKLEGLNRRDFYDFTPQSRPKGDRFSLINGINDGLPEWAVQAGYVVTSERRLSDDFRLVEVERRAQDSNR
ncbi:MAG: glycosyltransferase family 39 protein [Proteobacteria bacterium]|nr:MAG: glycosyltransferase family 39 protein [Pseudomonadota bacterium]